MTVSPRPIPVRPAPGTRPSDSFIRAIVAEARSSYQMGSRAETIAAKTWPDDRVVPLILTRAASAPATTGTSGWAAELAQSAVSDLIVSLGPASAGSELLRRAMMLSFDGSAQITVPTIVAAAADSPFVEEGSPVPIQQFLVSGGTALTPKKFGVGVMLTREVVEHVTAAERLVRAAVTESIAAALDSALLDATVASASRPAGIRNGVSATTATAGGGDAAMMKDLGNLAQAVSAIGGTQIAFVAAPGEAVKIALRAGPEFRFPILASSALEGGVVMCIALPAMAAAVSPEPDFSVSKDATIHAEDTSPAAIGIAGSPNVVAAPTRSLFQTDTVAIRIIFRVSWGLRTSGSVSWTENVSW